jgi:RNA polymerase sigma factor (sigma-70 family)
LGSILQNKKTDSFPTFLNLFRPTIKNRHLKIKFSINEVKLVRLCKKGDEKAQYRLYGLYSKAMYNIAVRMCGDNETAEDILQDSFVTAFSEIEKLNDEKAFGGWLKKIVINRSIDEVRKQKRSYSFDVISDHHSEIAEEIDENTDVELVHHLIKRLPAGAREILVLRALEGFRFAEIAEKLEITESTAKTQFFRAKQLLGKMISEFKDENEHRKIFERKPVKA